MAEERRLGAWDCPYCGTKKILGNVFNCPGCEVPRPRGIRFYTIPDGPIVTPEIAKQLGSGGPNWYCEHCDSGNRDVEEKCWKCGAPKGSSPSHEVRTYKHGSKVPTSNEEAEELDSDEKSWVEPKPIESSESKSTPQRSYNSYSDRFKRNVDLFSKDRVNKRHILVGGSVLLGLFLISFLIYQFFFNTHIEKVFVNGYSWSQNVKVQEYQVVHESSWGSHPSEAYNIYEDYRDTGRDRKVHDGYTTETYMGTCTRTVHISQTCSDTVDNGDGSFTTISYDCGYDTTETYSCQKTRQVELYHYEDIYDWYFEYDINKWVVVAKYPTSGSDHKPYFSKEYELINPYQDGNPQLGQQRDIQITGVYEVLFTCADNLKVGDEGMFTHRYPLDEWKKFSTNTEYEIEINAFNKILSYPVP